MSEVSEVSEVSGVSGVSGVSEVSGEAHSLEDYLSIVQRLSLKVM